MMDCADKCQADSDAYMSWFYDEAWRMFGRWIDRWREDHPDDERSDYEILMQEEYDP